VVQRQRAAVAIESLQGGNGGNSNSSANCNSDTIKVNNCASTYQCIHFEMKKSITGSPATQTGKPSKQQSPERAFEQADRPDPAIVVLTFATLFSSSLNFDRRGPWPM
jgi:hypothetical protein